MSRISFYLYPFIYFFSCGFFMQAFILTTRVSRKTLFAFSTSLCVCVRFLSFGTTASIDSHFSMVVFSSPSTSTPNQPSFSFFYYFFSFSSSFTSSLSSSSVFIFLFSASIFFHLSLARPRFRLCSCNNSSYNHGATRQIADDKTVNIHIYILVSSDISPSIFFLTFFLYCYFHELEICTWTIPDGVQKILLFSWELWLFFFIFSFILSCVKSSEDVFGLIFSFYIYLIFFFFNLHLSLSIYVLHTRICKQW